jgi:hypothetical protein
MRRRRVGRTRRAWWRGLRVGGGCVLEEEFIYDGWVDFHEEDDFVP